MQGGRGGGVIVNLHSLTCFNFFVVLLLLRHQRMAEPPEEET